MYACAYVSVTGFCRWSRNKLGSWYRVFDLGRSKIVTYEVTFIFLLDTALSWNEESHPAHY